jgi:hypothetical protein
MKILTLRCREAAPLISEAMDHPLPRVERIALRMHLLICRWCRRYQAQLAWLRGVAGRPNARDTVAQAALSIEAKQRLRRAITAGKQWPNPPGEIPEQVREEQELSGRAPLFINDA